MKALAKSLDSIAQGWLWLAVLLTPIVALAGGLGFQLVGFFIGMTGLLAWVVSRTGAEYLRSAWPIWILAFMTWAWVTTLWSPHGDPFWDGNALLLMGLVVSLLFVPFVVLKTPERVKPALTWVVIGAGLLGVALLLIDATSGFALSLWGDPVAPGGDLTQRLSDAEMNVGRGQVSYLQLLWPVSALLMLHIKRGWILVIAAFLGLILSAHSNNLSIVLPTVLVAGLFATLAWRRPRRGLILAFAFAIASLIFAPVLGLVSSQIDIDLVREIPLSWEHRILMWEYTYELIHQAPLIGHGFDAARTFDEVTFRAPDGRDITVMSMHPHNIGLQIWLETGIIGVLLAVGFLLALLKAVLKICIQPGRAFAATGLVVTITTSGAVTVGVWQHWWWALIVLAVSLICLVPVNPNKAYERKMSAP